MKRLFLVIFACAAVVPADANWSRASLEKKAEVTANRFQVPAEALKAICERESGWNPNALGSVGEIGLCQLRPQTAILLKGRDWRSELTQEERLELIRQELYDPNKNLEYAARYLRWMIREAKGDITLAIAAYNAGPGVIRYVHRVKDSMGSYDEGSLLPVASASR